MAEVYHGFDPEAGPGTTGEGYVGLPYSSSYGVDVATWMSWSVKTQELFLKDLNRSDEQSNYYQEDKPWYFEEAQQYQDYKEGDTTLNPFQPIIDTTKYASLGLVAIAAIVLFGGR